MIIVTIREAEAHLSHLIRKVGEGEEVVILRGSKPVAKLVPVVEVKRRRQPGSLKGKLHVGPEFFETLPENELGELGLPYGRR